MIPGFDTLSHYEILDISPGVDAKEIQEGYYRVREMFSKDSIVSYSLYSQQERETILRMIDEAYHTLIDENAREIYDRKLYEERVKTIKTGKAQQEVLPLLPSREKAEAAENGEISPELEPLEKLVEKKFEEILPSARIEMADEYEPEETEQEMDEAEEDEFESEERISPPEPEPETADQAAPDFVRLAPSNLEELIGKVVIESKADGRVQDQESLSETGPGADEEEPEETEEEIRIPGPAGRYKLEKTARDAQQKAAGRETPPDRPAPAEPPEKAGPAPPPRDADKPTAEPPARGREAFEDTVLDIPHPRKQTSVLDYLESGVSGEVLKKVREQKGITIDKVWEVTKIRRPILVAIEEENYKALPADVFLRGMIKTYAIFLEFDDPESLVKGYMERAVAAREWMD